MAEEKRQASPPPPPPSNLRPRPVHEGFTRSQNSKQGDTKNNNSSQKLTDR